MSRRYKYIGTCAYPGYGTTGEAEPALGCDDPYSVEFGAWLFVPDTDPADPGERGGYYVDPEHDLQYIGRDVSDWSDAQRSADDLIQDPHSLGVYSASEYDA